MKTLIVIATNNGRNFLPTLINSLDYVEEDHHVLVVDTGSTNKESVLYVDYLKHIYGQEMKANYFFVDSIDGGYDTGAYLHAYKNYKYDEYFFLQDSLEVKDPNFMNEFRSRYNQGAVAWIKFLSSQNGYDNEEQSTWVEDKLGTSKMPGFGIFGPIFYTKRIDLEKLELNANIMNCIPTNKNLQQAMERGWAIAFDLSGLPVECIEPFDIGRIHNGSSIFKKYFPIRP